MHVARRAGWVEERNTKTVFGTPSDHRLAFTPEQFNSLVVAAEHGLAFLGAVKTGLFDLKSACRPNTGKARTCSVRTFLRAQHPIVVRICCRRQMTPRVQGWGCWGVCDVPGESG